MPPVAFSIAAFFRVLIKALESPGAAVHLYLGFGRRDGLDVGVPSVAGGILRKQSRHFFRQFFVGGKTFEFVLNRKLFKYLLEHGDVHRTLRGIFDGRTPAFKNIIVFLIRCFSGVRQDDIIYIPGRCSVNFSKLRSTRDSSG